MSNCNLTAAQLSSIDLSKLPTEIVKAIHVACMSELRERRQVVSTQERAAMAAEATMYRGLKNPNRQFCNHLSDYCAELLAQDWTGLFSGDPEPKYYVYAHTHRTGKAVKIEHASVNLRFGGPPFYIGKGTGNRAYDMKRNQGHGATLSQLLKRGHRPEQIAHIISSGLSEPEALALESKLIYLFGTKYEPGRRGLLVNLEIPPRPKMNEGRIRIRQAAGMVA